MLTYLFQPPHFLRPAESYADFICLFIFFTLFCGSCSACNGFVDCSLKFLCLFAADLNRVNEKLSETEKVKLELQLKLDDLQSSESSAQVRQSFFF